MSLPQKSIIDSFERNVSLVGFGGLKNCSGKCWIPNLKSTENPVLVNAQAANLPALTTMNPSTSAAGGQPWLIQLLQLIGISIIHLSMSLQYFPHIATPKR